MFDLFFIPVVLCLSVIVLYYVSRLARDYVLSTVQGIEGNSFRRARLAGNLAALSGIIMALLTFALIGSAPAAIVGALVFLASLWALNH